ncbi:MAG: helix-turn-helix domain-containing protein [Clostridia bacterium]|nr:helix-turn-helix domain-containing protein [Clostridia bacterium]
MSYNEQLKLITNTFKKCRIASKIINIYEQNPPAEDCDFQTRAFYNFIKNEKKFIKKNCVYKIKTPFNLQYLYLLLPKDFKRLLVIGPFFDKKITQTEFLEHAENLNISPSEQNVLSNYFTNLPAINNDNFLFIMFDTFCDELLGTDYVFIDKSNRLVSVFNNETLSGIDENLSTTANAQIIEERYAFENELMQAISLGQTHSFNALFKGVNELAFKRRIPDALRDFKNYCITSNTLMRKAAEKGGVHPLYLHSVSSIFATRIEQIRKPQECIDLIREMFFTYCRLVNEANTKNYSPIVQKTVLYVVNNLKNTLTLDTIAKTQNVSKGYLSTVFKKDTGKTLTEFILQKRVEQAISLLTTTNLKVQTIALQCGFLDLQYFSKQFKKETGKSPLEYRKNDF